MSGSSRPLLPARAPHLFSMLLLDCQGSWDHLLWCIAWARTERCPRSCWLSGQPAAQEQGLLAKGPLGSPVWQQLFQEKAPTHPSRARAACSGFPEPC